MRRLLKAALIAWIGKLIWNRVQVEEEPAKPSAPKKRKPRTA